VSGDQIADSRLDPVPKSESQAHVINFLDAKLSNGCIMRLEAISGEQTRENRGPYGVETRSYAVVFLFAG